MSSMESLLELCADRVEFSPVLVAGREFYVRRLLVADLDAVEKAMADTNTSEAKMVGLVKLTLCDAAGTPLITTEEQEAALRKMPLFYLRAIFNTAAKINGLVEDDEGN